MSDNFVSRKMFIKKKEEYHEISIDISYPIESDGLFISYVKFSGVEKFDAKIRGGDGFNCLESAIIYVNGICKESDDPQFYLDEGNPYVGV